MISNIQLFALTFQIIQRQALGLEANQFDIKGLENPRRDFLSTSLETMPYTSTLFFH